MTREQAKKALNDGYGITHDTFFNAEYYIRGRHGDLHAKVLFRNEGKPAAITIDEFWQSHEFKVFDNGWHYANDKKLATLPA